MRPPARVPVCNWRPPQSAVILHCPISELTMEVEEAVAALRLGLDRTALFAQTIPFWALVVGHSLTALDAMRGITDVWLVSWLLGFLAAYGGGSLSALLLQVRAAAIGDLDASCRAGGLGGEEGLQPSLGSSHRPPSTSQASSQRLPPPQLAPPLYSFPILASGAHDAVIHRTPPVKCACLHLLTCQLLHLNAHHVCCTPRPPCRAPPQRP